MAGETDEIDFEDAIGIASFQVMTGRVPPINKWVDALVEGERADIMEGFL